MIGAGKLDRKVVIQSYSDTQDAFGQPVQTWTDLKTVPCQWKVLASTSTIEQVMADQEQDKTVAEFTIRYYSTLSTEHRFKFENEVYKILRIAERGRKRYQIVMAYALNSDILD